MKWPLKSKRIPRSRTPFFNWLYLSAGGHGGPDSTIVWTSELDWTPVAQFLKQYNQNNHRLVSSSHLLVQAVGRALALHPQLNRRVVGRRVYEFKSCNVCLAARVPQNSDVNVIQVHDADSRPLNQIAYIAWKKQMDFLRGSAPESRDLAFLRRCPGWLSRGVIRTVNFLDRWLVLPVTGRVDRLRESVVLVNDFSHARFPVMRGYKPSRQPGESKPLSVTLGRPETKVVWNEHRPVPKLIAPITVRGDHRICDGYQIAQFITTLINLLHNPAAMDVPTGNQSNGSADSRNNEIQAHHQKRQQQAA